MSIQTISFFGFSLLTFCLHFSWREYIHGLTHLSACKIFFTFCPINKAKWMYLPPSHIIKPSFTFFELHVTARMVGGKVAHTSLHQQWKLVCFCFANHTNYEDLLPIKCRRLQKRLLASNKMNDVSLCPIIVFLNSPIITMTRLILFHVTPFLSFIWHIKCALKPWMMLITIIIRRKNITLKAVFLTYREPRKKQSLPLQWSF